MEDEYDLLLNNEQEFGFEQQGLSITDSLNIEGGKLPDSVRGWEH